MEQIRMKETSKVNVGVPTLTLFQKSWCQEYKNKPLLPTNTVSRIYVLDKRGHFLITLKVCKAFHTCCEKISN